MVEYCLPEGVNAWIPDSPNELARKVVDNGIGWWIRRQYAIALTGRVPFDRALALLDLARDDGVEEMLRAAVIQALSTSEGPHLADLSRWLRTVDLADKYGRLPAAVMWARAALGDVTVAPELVARTAQPWNDRTIEAALNGLIDRVGLSTLFGVDSPRELMLSGETPGLRLLGVRRVDLAAEDVTPALADGVPAVARAAYNLLAGRGWGRPTEVESLQQMVRERTPGHLLALAVLARWAQPSWPKLQEVRAEWARLGKPRIEVPGLPEDVREAILRRHVPSGTDTDPLWILEAAVLPPTGGPNTAEFIDRATADLAAAGLEPGKPEWIVDRYHGNGEGTYYTVATVEGTVLLSTLGPYFAVSDFRLSHTPDDPIPQALSRFRHIDNELGNTTVPDLYAFDFGESKPLTVRGLLFYWQD